MINKLKTMFKKISKLKNFFIILILAGSFLICMPQSNAVVVVPGGEISGQITDSKTNNLLANATIQLIEDSEIIAETTSDENGEYFLYTNLCNFQPGVNIKASLQGYIEQEISGINVPCWGGVVVNIALKPEAKEINPVILIPGIMGSWNVPISGWQIDPLLHTYDNLWSALQKIGCDTATGCIYVKDQNLFAFPYQWRVSNELTAYDLMRKIDEVQQITGANKVDIIAHSMGGLVARYYIENELFLQDNDSTSDVDVDQIIFLGTPHQGATKDYLVWEGGDVGTGRVDWLTEKIFSIEADFNGYGSIFQYIRNLPITSVQELLPIFNYLKDKDTGILRQYPNNYPENTFLQNLNLPEKLNKMNLVKGLNIIGKMGNDSTINILRVGEYQEADGKWEHGYPDGYDNLFGDHGLEYAEGDKTVPNISNNEFLNWQTVVLNYDHSDLVTEAQKIIIKELTDIEPIEIIKENIFSKWLLIAIHSPLDFQIIAPDGKILGKDFTNNNILNQISGAFYSGFDNTAEFALIPNPLNGEYTIKLIGTGNGDYTLIVNDFNNDAVNDSSVSGNINLNDIKEYVFNYNQSANEPVVINEVINKISIDDIIDDVEQIIDNKGFKNKGQGVALLAQLKIIKKWDSKISQDNKKIKNKIYTKLILTEIEFIKKQLDFMLKKNKVNQESYNILINDLNLLKLNYQE
ncbi:MAG: hypothetical protein ABIF17_05110 [Patescibacteria group bacterium]